MGAENFPQVLPPNSVYGNATSQSGPGMAVPLSSLAVRLLPSPAVGSISATNAISSAVVPTSIWSQIDAANAGLTLSNNNLSVFQPSVAAAWRTIRGTNPKSSGKWYFEIKKTIAGPGNDASMIGVANISTTVPGNLLGGSFYSAGGGETFNIGAAGGFTAVSGATLPAGFPPVGLVYGLAIDFDAQKIWLSQNGGWVSGDPAAGTNPVFGIVLSTTGPLFPAMSLQTSAGGTWVLQATSTSLSYAPPSGFSAWDDSANLAVGTWGVFKSASTGAVELAANDGGILRTLQLSNSNFVTDFGAVGDGATDNSNAWNLFNAFARIESTAGRGVTLVIPPGTYNFDHSLCQGFLYGIKKLHIIGYGATLQNTYNQSIHGANSAFEWAWSPACQINLFTGYLISTTAVGDTHVTLLTPAQNTNFAVGDWVMVSSNDVQYFGAPPNCDQFEFAQVSAKNAGTGEIDFANNYFIRYKHRSDFPDGGNASAPCGAARIWQLAYPAVGSIWDLDHVYEGLEIRQAPTSSLSYMNMSGRSIKYLNSVMVGISPSVIQRAEFIGGVMTAQSEPDKLVNTLLVDGAHIKAARFAFQSSSIDCVTIRNCKIDYDLECGPTKQMLVQNCDIYGFSEGVAGQPYGTGRSVALDNCRVFIYTFFDLIANNGVNVIDSNVSYTNGVFAVLKSGQVYQWGVVPGSVLNITGPGNVFTGVMGNGVVTKIYEDSTKVYFETTLSYASLPAWATGVMLLRNNQFSVRNCTGNDPMVQMSEMTTRGLKLWENFHGYFDFKNNSSLSGSFGAIPGNLLTITVNVLQTTSVGGGIFRITVNLLLTAGMTTGTATVPLVLSIDATTAGLRTITQAAWTGKVGSDAMTLSGGAQATLPTGYIVSSANPSWVSMGSPPVFPNPLIEVSYQTDSGFTRTFMPLRTLNP